MTNPSTPAASSAPPQLAASKRVGAFALALMIIAASAPLTVVAGGVTANFGVTGLLGIPLSFIVLGVVLALFAVGYAALSAKVRTAGAFYSYVSRGLGRIPGVGSAWVAIVAYNAMQIGIYGMFGFATADMFSSVFHLEVSWWVCALAGWVLVGILGVNAVDLSAKVLGFLVALEFVVVTAYDIVAVANPAEGLSSAGMEPSQLFAGGVGAALAFSVAAFMGFESGAIYIDEVKDPQNTVRRATFGAVAVVAVFYAFSAWAMVMGSGPSKVVQASATDGPGVVFGTMATFLPMWSVDVAQVLFVTSLLAALVSFHNVVARYLRSLAREGALPHGLARSRGAGQAPVAGSLTQSVLALVVLVVFAILGNGAEDPIMFPVVTLFTWLTNVGALGLVALMALTSFAAIGYMRRHPDGYSLWTRLIAPGLAGLSLGTLTVLIMVNFQVLVALEADSPLNWILPGLVVVAFVVGVVWAARLKASDPARYQGIGHGGAAAFLAEDDASAPEGADAALRRATELR